METLQDMIKRVTSEQSQVVAAAYTELKLRLADEYRTDRVAYTKAKGDFIQRAMHQVRKDAWPGEELRCRW